jgi:predicted RNA-binding Zn ribbon-like protein
MTDDTEADPKRAPEPLELVQRFVNSAELDEDREELSTPEALRTWFAGARLMAPDEPVTEGDLRRAIDVREGLRALLLCNNGGELDRLAVERLKRAASRAGLRVGFVEGAPSLEPDATGVDGALARLLAVVATTDEPTWRRLKACRHEPCRWAFYDRSKNRSGKWCTMDVCGNLEKARAYRARRRGEATA